MFPGSNPSENPSKPLSHRPPSTPSPQCHPNRKNHQKNTNPPERKSGSSYPANNLANEFGVRSMPRGGSQMSEKRCINISVQHILHAIEDQNRRSRPSSSDEKLHVRGNVHTPRGKHDRGIRKDKREIESREKRDHLREKRMAPRGNNESVRYTDGISLGSQEHMCMTRFRKDIHPALRRSFMLMRRYSLEMGHQRIERVPTK